MPNLTDFLHAQPDDVRLFILNAVASQAHDPEINLREAISQKYPGVYTDRELASLEHGAKLLRAGLRGRHYKNVSFRVGNLVRHKSGGPIMIVEDVWVGVGTSSPELTCTWVEDRERKFARFKGDMVETVYADGSPRDYTNEA
jgi:uncharacterized protein YodC (DUF2158 family)